MKKLAAASAIATISLVGMGATASATPPPYPPPATLITLSDSTVGPGAPFTTTLTGCLLGEVVTFTVSGDSDTAPCSATAGAVASANGELTAPTTPGGYPVVATGATSGVTATATLTVLGASGSVARDDDDADAAAAGSGDVLPSTGSSSAPIAQIGAGVLAAGLGLTGVAMYRRRSRAIA